MTHGARLRSDGRLVRDMYLLRAKTPGESTGPWDLFKAIGRVPGEEAFRPASAGNCPYVKP